MPKLLVLGGILDKFCSFLPLLLDLFCIFAVENSDTAHARQNEQALLLSLNRSIARCKQREGGLHLTTIAEKLEEYGILQETYRRTVAQVER